MDLSASYTFAAPPATVWNLLNDMDVVASCLPGCERLEPIGEDRYRADLTLAVAAVSGRYSGTVAILDKQPPNSYRLVVEGTGKSGFVKGEATVQLVEEQESTIVTVTGQGQVGGLIARVGQRLLGHRVEDDDGSVFRVPAGKGRAGVTGLTRGGALVSVLVVTAWTVAAGRATADQDLHRRRRTGPQQRHAHRQGLARLSLVLHRRRAVALRWLHVHQLRSRSGTSSLVRQ